MREKARKLLNGRDLVFALNQGQSCRWEPDVFGRFVELAAEFGATHIHVGEIPFRYGDWVLPDNVDPYASWCVTSPGILRTCPPEEIQPWVSLEAAQAVRDVIHAQLDIMRPHGLKAVSYAVEPMWLPEGVYRAHPRWRGPQCELGRIACKPYFCPSIDEPEVLDLYRRAMCEYSTLFPEIDQFSFLGNDSGSGLSWTPNIYPGMNGPTRWRLRDGGERVAGWLKALKAGAADAGVSVRFNTGSAGLTPELVASTRAKLEPGLFVNHGNDEGERWGVAGAGLGGGIWSLTYPVPCMGDLPGFVGALQSIYSNPDGDTGRCHIGMGGQDMERARAAMATVVEDPGTGLMHRMKLTLKVAERICGSAGHAEKLIGVWQTIGTALHGIAQIRQKGFGLVIPFCGVSTRWIVRPLVPQPELLTPEETAHYRDFVFAPGDAKDDPNFGLVLGKAVFNGESVAWMARWCLDSAIRSLRGARATLAAMADQIEDAEGAARIRLMAARVGATACMARNAKNTIMFKYALDIREQPQYGPNQMDYDDNMICDQRSLSMRKIAREELDNIAELIEIIESQEGEVVDFARSPDEESVFILGPNLVDDLRRKMDIMLDHWHDYERLYPTTKMWDFEPEPRGNLTNADDVWEDV